MGPNRSATQQNCNKKIVRGVRQNLMPPHFKNYSKCIIYIRIFFIFKLIRICFVSLYAKSYKPVFVVAKTRLD